MNLGAVGKTTNKMETDGESAADTVVNISGPNAVSANAVSLVLKGGSGGKYGLSGPGKDISGFGILLDGPTGGANGHAGGVYKSASGVYKSVNGIYRTESISTGGSSYFGVGGSATVAAGLGAGGNVNASGGLAYYEYTYTIAL